MRITKNTNDSTCHLCHKPIRKGELAANYSVTFAIIRRGHPECVRIWTDSQVKQYVGNRYKKSVSTEHARTPSDSENNTPCEDILT